MNVPYPKLRWFQFVLLAAAAIFATRTLTTWGDEPTQSPIRYPISVVATAEDTLYVVDLDLPGLFKKSKDSSPQLFHKGSDRFREPLNRPRCVAVTPEGSVLIGDTASREVYLLDGSQDPKPLTGGNVGIPMSLVVRKDQVFVADLETRFILKFPLSGGPPETFAKINTRGLFLDHQDQLWAVTQEEAQLVIVDLDAKVTPVVKSRVFEFPHNVVVLPDQTAYVTDGYRKAIWRVIKDGAPEIFVEGAPLVNPVGLAVQGDRLLVADPHAKQVFRVKLANKEIEAAFP